jgi:uncharacterized membrane-anchored protein
MWKAIVIGVVFWVGFLGLLYFRSYLPAAERHAREEAQVTAQSIACNAMYTAALDGRVRLTPRDEAYCATIGEGF